MSHSPTHFPGRFAGKVAVVTGSAQGIGADVSRRLVHEGASVALVDRSDLVHEVQREPGPAAVAVTADLETFEGATDAIAAAMAAFGRIDIPINNVGGTIWAMPFAEYTPAQIESEIRRSLFPTLWCSRAVLPPMLKQGGGVIVNVSSVATRGVNRAPYAAAKGGADVWHANTLGGYSHFDPSQPKFNLRRRIETDAEGRYRLRSLLPAGYGCPPDGVTQALLTQIGRHGQRPAHIHFFVAAPGYRKLTTQINIDGDAYLYDDFAFATRDGLIPPVRRIEDAASVHAKGLNAPYAEITFDFVLHPEAADAPNTVVIREHAPA